MKIKTKITYFFFAFLCTVTSLYGQQVPVDGIYGTVKEKNTGLANASINLTRAVDNVVQKTVMSGMNGEFKIPAPPEGIYFIVITHLGYDTYKGAPFNYNSKSNIIQTGEITLQKEASSLLNEVVIKSSIPLIEQKIDKVIVNVDAVLSNSGASLLDALNNAPGILADESGGISYRGKSGVKVFMDGKPVFLSGNDLAIYLRSLPASSVSKIEIMSNPPAKYNAEGSAGIIDIKTKKTKTEGFNGAVSSGYSQGVYPKLNNAFNFNYRVNNLNVYGNLSYSYIKGFFNSSRQRLYNDAANLFLLTQEYDEKSATKNYSNKVGIDYDINKKTKIGALFNGSINSYRENGNYTNRFLSNQTQLDSSILVKSRVNTRTVNNAFSTYLTHSYSDKKEINIDVDYLEHKNKSSQYSESNTYFPGDIPGGQYILLSNTPFNARIYGIKSDYNQQFSNGLKLQTGLQFVYSLRNSSGNYLNQTDNGLLPNEQLNNDFKYKENINAGYVNFNKDYKRFSFQAGLRVENTYSNGKVSYNKSNSDSSFTIKYLNAFPTAYLSYNLDSTANNKLRFSAGRRITRPSYQDLNPSVFFFDKYTSNQGNPLLQPEYSMNFELGYSHKSDFNLTFVYTRTKNAITQIFEQVNGVFISNTINVDHFRTIGVNANVVLNLTEWWTSTLYTELTNNSYRGNIGNNGLLNNNLTTFRITGINKFKIGEKWSTEVNNFYRSSIIFGQVTLRPAWQVHAAVRRSLMNNNASITLTARDIFKSWVVDRDVAIKNAQINFSNTFDTHLLTIAFTYRFGNLKSKNARTSGIDGELNRIK